jgi:pSer/pThr/pTyr-binding forkhead associated (FHA) protein
MLIGRRSATRRIYPEIDLVTPQGGPLTDTAVDREHARLVARPDGSWSLTDLGSVNGTMVNGRKIDPGTPVPLHDGDRINIGMWTAITITRAPFP